MSDIINEFHRKHRVDKRTAMGFYREPVRKIVCKDGFNVSVQASQYCYCNPRETYDGPYDQFELGFPSEPVPELIEWRDGDGEDTHNVFGYVPVGVIVALIEKHGGIDEDAA